jgi:hypothetical protein
MPRRAKTPPAPPPVQLPLFAETASLVRIRPALNEWRFYRMEVWPDCSAARCWFGSGAASALKVIAGSIPIPIPAPRSTRSPPCCGPSVAAVTRTGRNEIAKSSVASRAEIVAPAPVARRRRLSSTGWR